jgi:hypothetical protein
LIDWSIHFQTIIHVVPSCWGNVREPLYRGWRLVHYWRIFLRLMLRYRQWWACTVN